MLFGAVVWAIGIQDSGVGQVEGKRTMTQPRRTTAWLLATVLGGLFVLSTISPRWWRAGAVKPESAESETAMPLESVDDAIPESMVGQRQKSEAVVVRPIDQSSLLNPTPAILMTAESSAPVGRLQAGSLESEENQQFRPLSAQAAPLPSPILEIVSEKSTMISADASIVAEHPVKDEPTDQQSLLLEPADLPSFKEFATAVKPRTVEPASVTPASKIGQQVRAVSEDESGAVPMPSESSSENRPALKVANIPSPIHVSPRENSKSSIEAIEALAPDDLLQSSATTKATRRDRAERNADDGWREPETLLKDLNALASTAETKTWASEVIRQIQALGKAISGHSEQSAALLEQLAERESQARLLARNISNRPVAMQLARTAYALGRRIDVWQEVVQLSTRRIAGDGSPDVSPQKLALCLADIDGLTAKSQQGQAWRDYLLIDALKEAAKRGAVEDVATRQLAQQVLARIAHTPLTSNQRKFVAEGPIAMLHDELRRWAAEPIGAAIVLRDVETFERTRLPSDAERLARDCQNLAVSSLAGRRQLAERVDLHYRNANIRIAVTEDLINSIIPERQLEYANVDDTVLGRPVWGESIMTTDLAVRMLPDASRVRMLLEVRGQITAATTAEAGPIQFQNDSETYYVARKPLEIDMTGVSVWPVEVGVENSTELRGISTPLDGVPLIGPVARGIAKTQSDQSKLAASEEVKQKIAAQARARVDAEAKQRLSEFVTRMNERLFDPLNALSLDPQLVAAETTQKRFTMRLRLAGEDQLGSHTPRPQAPADCLASMQIHESVLNNSVQRLQLNGRTFSLSELSQHVANRLSRPTTWEVTPEHADVKITFAPKDAVVVRFQDGKIAVTLSIVQLSKGPRKWKNFQVQAFYRPEVQGCSAQLAREGVVRLIGRLNTGAQIALRGIFSRALSKNSALDLVPSQIVKEPKLSNAAITQFVIEDGWIGVSIGLKPVVSTARRTYSNGW